jgi:hypothetical protein
MNKPHLAANKVSIYRCVIHVGLIVAGLHAQNGKYLRSEETVEDTGLEKPIRLLLTD